MIKGISIIALVLGLLILPFTYSRAVWFSSIISFGLILTTKYPSLFYNKLIKLKIGLVIVICLLGSLSYGLYHLKPLSADGRVLIWKISFDMIKKRPWLGIGYGHFKSNYNNYQAYYFSKGNSTVAERNLADSVDFAYNELINITVELGIVGLIAFLSIIIYLNFKRTKGIDYNEAQKFSDKTAIICINSILLSGLFSYPFSILSIHVLFFIFISIISAFQKSVFKFKIKSKVIILFVITTIFIFQLFFVKAAYSNYRAYENWESLSLYDSADKIYINGMQELYYELDNNSRFLAEYGKALLDNKNYSGASNVLQEANNLKPDPYVYCNLGLAYQAQEKYDKASENFLFASHIIPHLLYPRFLLAELYYRKGELKRSRQLAVSIIQAKPKIPSVAFDEIQNKSKALIQDIDGRMETLVR